MAKRTPPQDPPEAQDDAALFRAAIGPVRELPAPPPPPAGPKPRARPRMAERDEDDARAAFRRSVGVDVDMLEAGDPLAWRRDDLPPRVLQRLRRGQYAAQDEIDLHHVDAARAEAMLRGFLKEAVQAGFGCVRIVHGKGLHSETGVPVIKNLVDRLLRQRAEVLAFHSAPPAQGGRGAVLVLLRQRR